MVCRAVILAIQGISGRNTADTRVNRTHREVQVPKSLFRNTHWVDNLCQCESFLADLPEISGFALTPDFAEIQERYVSAAGRTAHPTKRHHTTTGGIGHQA